MTGTPKKGLSSSSPNGTQKNVHCQGEKRWEVTSWVLRICWGEPNRRTPKNKTGDGKVRQREEEEKSFPPKKLHDHPV